jgi:hypothetical protein
LEVLIACKKLFGAFLEACRRHHPNCGPQVGLPANGPEMHFLFRRLFATTERNFIALDAKGYDLFLNLLVRRMYSLIVEKWYAIHFSDEDPRNVIARRKFLEAMMQNMHIFRHTLYARFNGQTSGNPQTAEENSYCTEIMMLSCMISHFDQLEPSEVIRLYDDSVAAFYYGDDLLLGVPDELSSFNQLVVQREMKELFNMTYTTASKEANVPEWCPREEISFLKRQPFLYKGFYVGRLPMSVCVEMALWYRKSKHITEEQATLANVRASLEEVFFHGREEFNKLSNLYAQILATHKFKPLVLSYEDCEKTFGSKL